MRRQPGLYGKKLRKTSMFRFEQYLKENKTLVIAELANAFEGKKDTALRMIDVAAEASADALKFQIFFADELMVPDHPKYDMFKSLETTRSDWHKILEYAAITNRLVFIDVFGEESFQFSRNFKVDAYKIPPSDMTNLELISLVGSAGKSMILSAGAATLEELERAVSICHENGQNDLAIMHGFQAYPTSIEDTNLNRIETLKKHFYCPIGYADHVDGGSDMAILVPLLAVARGAQLVEKHFTLNRNLQGTDYQSSVNPDVLKKMVQYIKDTDLIFGTYSWELSPDEQTYKHDVRKRLVAKRNLTAGETISREDILLKRAPSGIFSDEINKVVGRKIIRKVEANKALENTYLA